MRLILLNKKKGEDASDDKNKIYIGTIQYYLVYKNNAQHNKFTLYFTMCAYLLSSL